jgi:hypothetical protein
MLMNVRGRGIRKDMPRCLLNKKMRIIGSIVKHGNEIKPESSRGDENLNFVTVIPTCPYNTKLTCSLFYIGN